MGLKFNPFTGTFDFTGSGSGATAFTGLSDVPSSYASQALKVVRVNAGETALEFTTLSGGGDALTSNPLSQFASTTSLQLKGVISDETGSGALVFANTPTLVTPILGTPTSGNLANCTFPTLNQDTTGSAGSLKSPSTTGVARMTGMGNGTTRDKTVRDANDTLLELGGSYTPTGTWTSLTMVTPVLGTPTSGTLTNCTGLPVSTGVSGLGSNVATFLATPSSANLISAVTDETGTGALVFANTPTLVTPILGTPTSGTLTNCTGYTDANLSTSDVTTNNASTSKHGFLKKLSNTATEYMDGTGNWSTPGGGSGTNSCILTASGAGSSATRYFGMGQSGLENATETNIWTFKMPFAATLQKLYACVRTAPGAGTSWTITVRTDESVTDTMADTTLTCSIADTNTSASDTTHTPTVSAGKRVTVVMTRVSTAASPGNVTFSFEAVHS